MTDRFKQGKAEQPDWRSKTPGRFLEYSTTQYLRLLKYYSTSPFEQRSSRPYLGTQYYRSADKRVPHLASDRKIR
jgi:hypothetical protein